MKDALVLVGVGRVDSSTEATLASTTAKEQH